MNEKQIINILKNGSPADQIQFIQSCPDNHEKEGAISLIKLGYPAIIAIFPLAITYCNGINPSFGAILALAAHSYAVELFESGNRSIIKVTLSNFATQYVNALNLLGRSQEVIAFTNEFIPYYEHLAEDQNLPSLKVARINALINLNQIDEAEDLLNDPALKGNWTTTIEVDRLEKKLHEMKREIIELNTISKAKRLPSINNLISAENIDELKNWIKEFIPEPTKQKQLLGVIERMASTNDVDPKTKEGFEKLLAEIAVLENQLISGSSEENEWTIDKKIGEACAIFILQEKPSRETIGQSLAILQKSLQWAQENKHIQLENNALWGISLCYGRLDQPSLASDALLQLRRNLETTRKGIRNPLERGGVFSAYTHLFDFLCEELQLAGRTEELLENIEASKGRGIADILTLKSGRILTDNSIYDSAKRLPDLTRKYGFHYLTYYVDTDQTYIVLVNKKGDIYPIQPVNISKATIREASRFVDPRLWGAPSESDPDLVIEDVSTLLSPLIQCLETFIDQGILKKGDHLCYSADDNFHNVPLQYIKLDGKPLIDIFSISRIQNAFHLEKVLSESKNDHPKEFVSFIVPLHDDLQKPNWAQMQQNLRRPTNWLRQHLAGSVFENEMSTLEQIKLQNLNRKIIQFSTHGVFPRDDQNQNPFRESGLVLSDGEKLPNVNVVGAGNKDYVLTPGKMLDSGLAFNNSHISLMACVSGLSREGLGGDALGMEWAFIQAGAASLLSSHWYVSAELAALFFESFYFHWLLENKSRAQAFSDTINELRAQKGSNFYNNCWAVFSLTGDWR